jgi:hypothetical protein
LADFVNRLWKFAGLSLLIPILSSCDFFDSKMVTACEQVLKNRLLAPSEHRRIEIQQSEEPIGRADYQRYFTEGSSTIIQEALTKDFDRGHVKPVMYEILITYDTPNAYGTPIRGISRCQYPTSDGDASRAARFSVIGDGETNTEWLRKQL